jgi:uncharacterized protein (TIGR00251 family)
MSSTSMIAAVDGGIVVDVHAVPGAKRAAITGTHGGALKIRVAAPPAGGAANRAVEEALASALGVARSAVEVITGPTSQRKRVKVTGIDEATARRILDSALAGPALDSPH